MVEVAPLVRSRRVDLLPTPSPDLNQAVSPKLTTRKPATATAATSTAGGAFFKAAAPTMALGVTTTGGATMDSAYAKPVVNLSEFEPKGRCSARTMTSGPQLAPTVAANSADSAVAVALLRPG